MLDVGYLSILGMFSPIEIYVVVVQSIILATFGLCSEEI